jgi:CcmD family protein
VYEFLTHHALYVVLIIAIIVWLGILGMLFRIDRRLRKLEHESGRQEG